MTEQEQLQSLDKAIVSLGFRIAALSLQLVDKTGEQAERVSVKINRYGKTLEILEKVKSDIGSDKAVLPSKPWSY